jgi:hypothetical protein
MNSKISGILANVLGAMLLGYLGAWLLMSIHLPPETLKIHEPGVILFLDGKGAAPDQYRLLQNHLSGLLYRVVGIYHSTFWFTAVSLAAAIFVLVEKAYPSIPQFVKKYLSIALTLLYPVLMYNGPRGDTAFILLLALGLTIAIEREDKLLFVGTLILMAFTRADIALFSALFAVLWKPIWFNPVFYGFIVALPIAVQGILQFIVFPDAHYYCDVVMIKQNMNFDRYVTTPAFLLFGALMCLYLRGIISFGDWLYRLGVRGKILILLFSAYLFAMFVVAIVAETRLFLPLAPFILLLVQEFYAKENKCLVKYEESRQL